MSNELNQYSKNGWKCAKKLSLTKIPAIAALGRFLLWLNWTLFNDLDYFHLQLLVRVFQFLRHKVDVIPTAVGEETIVKSECYVSHFNLAYAFCIEFSSEIAIS